MEKIKEKEINQVSNIEQKGTLPLDGEPPAKKNKTKYILFGCLGGIVLFVVLIVSLVLWGVSAVFDSEPLPEVVKNLDADKMLSVAEKFGINQNSVESEKDIAVQLLNTLLETKKTVTLTKGEANALLDYAVVEGRKYLKQKLPLITLSDAYFDKGFLYVSATYKNVFSTPFGRYLNMHITLLPGVENKHIVLNVKNLKVGSMIVSGQSLQKKLDEGLIDFEKTEDGRMFIEVVSKLDVQKESVTISFNPQKMTMMLLKSLQGGATGSGGGEIDASALLDMLQ